MILPIVEYGHPALRSKGSPVAKIDARIRKLAEDMIETMNDASGVGLAAQQIGRPIQMCVVDVADVEDRPSALRVEGDEVDLDEYMPLVLINPEIERLGEPESSTEGCLSFPGIQGTITRPGIVRVKALTIDGGTLAFEAAGLLARAIQHEHDHLHGILFIDRMDPAEREALTPGIDQIMRRNSAG